MKSGAPRLYAAAMAKGMDADFSIMIQFMEALAGVASVTGVTGAPDASAGTGPHSGA